MVKSDENSEVEMTPDETSFEDMLASAIEKSKEDFAEEEEPDDKNKCKSNSGSKKSANKNSGDKYVVDAFIR